MIITSFSRSNDISTQYFLIWCIAIRLQPVKATKKKWLAHTNRHIQFIDTSNLFIMMRTWLLLHSFQHVASKRMRMHRRTCVHTYDGRVCGGASALDRSLAPKDGWVDQNYRQRRHLIQNVSIVKVTLVSACLCCVECFRSCRLTSYVSVRCFHSSTL